MPSCAVPGCMHRREHGYKLFVVPQGQRNEERRRLWLQQIGREEPVPAQLFVCNVHFTEDQFERKDGKKWMLARHAVPTLFNNPSLNIPVTAVRKKVSKVQEKVPECVGVLKNGIFYEGPLLQDDIDGDNLTLCRICGKGKRDLVTVVKSDADEEITVADKIQMYLSVEVEADSEFPWSVCSTCVGTLNAWHELVLSFMATDALLRENGQLQEAFLMKTKESSSESQVVQETTEIQEVVFDEHCEELKMGVTENNPGDTAVIFEVNEYAGELDINNTGGEVEIYLDNGESQDLEGTIPMDDSTSNQQSLSQSRYRCKYCHIHFKNKREMRGHRSVCRMTPSLCELCGSSVTHRGALPKHYRQKHKDFLNEKYGGNLPPSLIPLKHEFDQKDKVCAICGVAFHLLRSLHEHQLTHGIPPTYFCDPCCATFPDNTALMLHLSRNKQHQETSRLVTGQAYSKSGDELEKFTCKICNEVFDSKLYFIMHFNATKSCKCPKCYKVWRNERTFFIHTTSCTGESEHKSKDEDSPHASHASDGENNFVCEKCDKTFYSLSLLTSHKVVHSPPSHICEVCGKGFVYRSLLREHSLLFHRGWKFPCKLCGKILSTKSSLTRHNKLCHRKGV